MSTADSQSSEGSLAIFQRGTQLLAEANTIQKAKELKDLALTAAEWARRKEMGEEAIRYCRSYALDAERKLGQFLKEADKNVGLKGSVVTPTGRVPLKDTAPTLADFGLSKNESAEAQILAEAPEEDFEKLKAGEIPKSKLLNKIRRTKRQAKPKRKRKPKPELPYEPTPDEQATLDTFEKDLSKLSEFIENTRVANILIKLDSIEKRRWLNMLQPVWNCCTRLSLGAAKLMSDDQQGSNGDPKE
jgi:hypothetical protein